MDIRYSIITDPDQIDVLRDKMAQYRTLDIQYDDETIRFLKDHLSNTHSLYLLATLDDQFAGFSATDADWWEDGYLFLREIFVEPSLHQRGIGSALMRQSIDYARNEHMKGIVTETAFENVPMQKLCAKHGFTEWENPDWKEGITYKLIF